MIRRAGWSLLAALALLPWPTGSSQVWTVHREEVTITAEDGEPLAATLWSPAGPGVRPALLLAHGFGGTRADLDETAQRHAALGYAALAWDARGFGESGGTIGLNGPKEVSDVSRLVTFLAERPGILLDAPGDPRVGMQGGSYGGAIQLLAAANDPRIDALVPTITWNNLEYSLYPNEVLKQAWVLFYYGAGTAAGQGVTGGNPNPGGMDPSLSEAFADAMANNSLSPKTRALLWERSPARVLDDVRAPTLLVQGWHDTLFTANEAAWTYERLRANGVPAKLLLYSAGHGWEETMTLQERDLRRERVHAWFEYWLKGVGSGPDLYRAPVEWWDAPQARFQAEQSWPLIDLAPQVLFFDVDAAGSGHLSPSPPPRPTRALLGSGGLTSYSEVPEVQSTLSAPAAEAPGASIEYRTGPLSYDLAFLGEARLRVWAATTSTDAALFVKVYVEAPDGTETLLDRQVTPLRIRGPDSTLAQPRPYDVALTILHDTIPLGHGLRVTLATSDASFSPSRAPGAVALFHDPADPATLTLPVPRGDRESDVLPPVISGVDIEASVVEAEITDPSGVAAAYAIWADQGMERVAVGVPAGNDTYSFDVLSPGARDARFYLVAVDPAGNQATTGSSVADLGSRPEPGAEAPIPPSVGLIAIALAVVLRRSGRSPPSTDTLMKFPR